jgi:hypothetical protein
VTIFNSCVVQVVKRCQSEAPVNIGPTFLKLIDCWLTHYTSLSGDHDPDCPCKNLPIDADHAEPTDFDFPLNNLDDVDDPLDDDKVVFGKQPAFMCFSPRCLCLLSGCHAVGFGAYFRIDDVCCTDLIVVLLLFTHRNLRRSGKNCF